MNFKKVLALVLVVAMCLSMVPAYAFAEDVELWDEEEVAAADDTALEDVYIDEDPVVVEEEPEAIEEETAAPAEEPAEEPAEVAEVTETEAFEAPTHIVAEIGSAQFTTLQEAINYAGETIDGVKYESVVSLIDNTTEKTIAIAKEITLASDNKTITGTVSFNDGAKVKVSNIIFDGDVTVDAGEKGITFVGCTINGKLSLKSGEVVMPAADGTLTSVCTMPLDSSIEATGGTLSIAGGTFNCYAAGSGEVVGNVTGGSFAKIDKVLLADWYVTDDDYDNGKAYCSGVATLTDKRAMVGTGADRHYGGVGSTIDLTKEGGTYESQTVTLRAISFKYNMEAGQTIYITNDGSGRGWVYNTDANYGPKAPEGCTLKVEPKDGIITITATPYIASVDGEAFDTFAEAVEAARATSTDLAKIVVVMHQPEEHDIGYVTAEKPYVKVKLANAEIKEVQVDAKGTNVGYGVQKQVDKDVTTYVCVLGTAKFDSNLYPSLEEAMKAVPETRTGVITMLGDDTVDDDTIFNGKTVEIDLQKHTVTLTPAPGSSLSFTIDDKTNVTFENGTLNANDAKFAVSGELNLSNVKGSAEFLNSSLPFIELAGEGKANLDKSEITILANDGSSAFVGDTTSTKESLTITDSTIEVNPKEINKTYDAAFQGISDLLISEKANITVKGANHAFWNIGNAKIENSTITADTEDFTVYVSGTDEKYSNYAFPGSKLNATIPEGKTVFAEDSTGKLRVALDTTADLDSYTGLTAGIPDEKAPVLYYFCNFSTAAVAAIKEWDQGDGVLPVINLIGVPTSTDIYTLKPVGQTYESLKVKLNGRVTPEKFAGTYLTVNSTKAIIAETVDGITTFKVGKGDITLWEADADEKVWKNAGSFDSVEAAFAKIPADKDGDFYIKIDKDASFTLAPGRTLYVIVSNNAKFTAVEPPDYTMSVKKDVDFAYNIGKGDIYTLSVSEVKAIFDPNGGIWIDSVKPTPVDGKVVTTAKVGAAIEAPSEAPVNGTMAFAGWFDAEGKKLDDKYVMPSKDVTFTAKWEKAVATLTDKSGRSLFYTTIDEALADLTNHAKWFADGEVPTLVDDALYTFATDTTLKIKLNGFELTTLPDNRTGKTQDKPFERTTDDPLLYPAGKLDEVSGVTTYSMVPYVAQVRFEQWTEMSSHTDKDTIYAHVAGEDSYALFDTFEHAVDAALKRNGTTERAAVVMMADNGVAYTLTAAKLGTKVLVVERPLSNPYAVNVYNEAGALWTPDSKKSEDGQTQILSYKMTGVFNVTFNFNGEDFKDEVVSVEENKTVTDPTAEFNEKHPVVGKKIKNWNIYPKPATNDKEFDFTKPITKDITLYAQWENVKTSVITLTAATPTGVQTESFKGNIGKEITKEERNAALARFGVPPAGYEYVWYYDKAMLDEQRVEEFPTKFPEKDLTLYGKLERATYTIAYDFNGGSKSEGNEDRYIEKYTYGETAIIPNPDVPKEAGPGYVFKGWKGTRGTNTVIDTTNDGTDPVSKQFELKDTDWGNITLKAVWSQTKFSYKFVDLNLDTEETSTVYAEGFAAPGDDITIPANPTKTGFKFIGWNWKTTDGKTGIVDAAAKTFKATNTDITFAADWDGTWVTVTWILDDSHKTPTYHWTLNKLAAPTVSVDGSSVTVNGVKATNEGKTVDPKDAWTVELPKYIDSSTSFTLKWVEQHTVTFEHEGVVIKTLNVTDGEKIKESAPAVTDSEHKSLNWIDQDGNFFNKDTVVTKDLTFTVTREEPPAPPTPTDSYVITWMNGTKVLAKNEVEKGKTPVFTGDTPVEEGKYFVGWANEEKRNEVLDPIPAASAAATYYAVFKTDEVKASYSVGIGSSFDIGFKINQILNGTEISDYSIYADGKLISDDVTLGKYVVVTSKAAKEMCDEVVITVEYEGETVFSGNYSVRGYAESKLAKNPDGKLKTLLEAIVDYGARAQEYFNYNTKDLANRGKYHDQLPVPPATNDKVGSAAGITGMTFALSTETQNEFRVSVKHDAGYSLSDYVFSVTRQGNEVNITPVDDGKKFVFDLGAIEAAKLGDEFVITVKDAAGSTYTITTSPVNYMYTLSKKTDTKLANMGTALYIYYMAAKNYKSV